MRTITLMMDEDFCEGYGVPEEEHRRVLNYLIWWGKSYPFVTVYDSADGGDMVATYRHEEGTKPAYVIGAIFNRDTGKYSTHS